jgi:hypothetical protein
VIMGDFNINLLHTHTVEDVACFLDLLYSNGFFPAILKPTRITAHSSTLIDNIFINSPAFLQSGLITYDISDHMPIYVVLPGHPENLLNNAQTNTSPVKQYQRAFTPEALHNIKQALLTAHWEFLSDYSSVHDDYDKLVHVIITTCNKFARIKALVSKSKPRNNTPWITPALVKSCNTRRKLYIKALTKKIPWHVYSKYRNKLNSLIRAAKKHYICRFVSVHKQNSSAMWNMINNHCGRSFCD